MCGVKPAPPRLAFCRPIAKRIYISDRGILGATEPSSFSFARNNLEDERLGVSFGALFGPTQLRFIASAFRAMALARCFTQRLVPSCPRVGPVRIPATHDEMKSALEALELVQPGTQLLRNAIPAFVVHVDHLTFLSLWPTPTAPSRERNQAVSTVNRCLVSVRRFYGWLKESRQIAASPAEAVKELRRQDLAPKTLARSEIRKLLRECEARHDLRAAAIFNFLLYTGARVSELAALEQSDLVLSERSGWATFRLAKGGKQRTVPVPLVARRALEAYLASRPPLQTSKLFVGERGPLTTRGVRAICAKYSAICGMRIHPHLLRHVFGHEYLASNSNDLVGLASLLGHENLNTTRRYVQRTADQLHEATERVAF